MHTVPAMAYRQKQNLGTSDLCLGGVLNTIFQIVYIHTALSHAEFFMESMYR